ncbi:MAG: NAD(P)H-hydrate epimerase, partial [Acidimicrobiales bacterium]
MIPVVTPAEMGEIDRGASEPVEVLVGRAGAATASAALRLLGGAYGRRVVVVAGGGNNGADGRAAAVRLSARGARVRVVPPSDPALPEADLVVDAAYGTGLSRPYNPADPGRATVLAVDIPSGVNGATGEIPEGGEALEADETVTFGALKPGLLLGAGPAHTGPVTLAGIGLAARAAEVATCWLVTDDDVARLLPSRPPGGHKWKTAVGVISGSPGMTGAPWLVSLAAMRAGAGYVRLGIPGVDPGRPGLPPGEAVGVT